MAAAHSLYLTLDKVADEFPGRLVFPTGEGVLVSRSAAEGFCVLFREDGVAAQSSVSSSLILGSTATASTLV